MATSQKVLPRKADKYQSWLISAIELQRESIRK